MLTAQMDLHSVTYYRPKVLKHKIDSRPLFSICLVFEGEYCYTQGGEQLHLKASSAVFLPKGAKYSYNIITPTEKTLVGQITFDFSVSDYGSDLPSKVTLIENADELFEIFHTIKALYDDDPKTNALKLVSQLLKLIDETVLLIGGAKKDLISKAAEIIGQNQSKKIPVESLAKMCKLSESQFRKRFTKRYGMSPIKYKNHLRIEHACRLLNAEQFNIAEISEMLSFDTPYAFSKTFKSVMGISPKKYISNTK